MAKILLADDDLAFVDALTNWLESEHYVLDVVYDGKTALERLESFEYDAIVLDWNMPGASGLDVCKRYRAAGGLQPLLILTGKDIPEDIETGLDNGADDYVTKPANFSVLSARLRALMRRPASMIANELTVRDLVLDTRSRKVTKNGKEVSLQPVEFNVLEFLLKHPAQDFSIDILLQRIWGSDQELSNHAIYSCVKRLRKKLETDGESPLIVSKYGVGYRLEP